MCIMACLTVDFGFGDMAINLEEHLKEASVAARPLLALIELIICSTRPDL